VIPVADHVLLVTDHEDLLGEHPLLTRGSIGLLADGVIPLADHAFLVADHPILLDEYHLSTRDSIGLIAGSSVSARRTRFSAGR